MRVVPQNATHDYKNIAFNLQAGEEESEIGETSTGAVQGNVDSQNVAFVENMTGEVVDMTTSDYTHLMNIKDYTPGIDLQDFLKRPVLLYTFTLASTDAIGTLGIMAPWKDYFAAPEIQRKLHNYAFIKCDLHVKVVINASPFYYGAYMLNYRPLGGFISENIKFDPTFNSDLVLRSQRPHIWIYPQTNAGGELILPFFYHKNWLETTSHTILTKMGELSYVCFAPLRSANGATGPGSQVEMQIFVWAENVELMGSTYKLAVQAGKDMVYKSNDYKTGPISKPASAIATIAGKLSSVPEIGPFAQATSMAASAVGEIASLFGYTNVPNISDVSGFTPKPFPHLASPEISTMVEKMSLDPKNEISIDPRTVGLKPDDELSIKYIIKRKSFMVQFAYTHLNTPGEVLFSATVQPVHYISNGGVNPYYYMSPMGYISHLFKYWRGDIIFTVKVICTKFHKGRLRFTYDPVANTSSAVPTFPTAFTRILDISEVKEFDIIVPYNQATSWLTCVASPAAATGQYIANNNTVVQRVDGVDNGTVSITVLNTLSSPIASADVSVFISIRGGDNLEFANPRDPPQGYSYFAAQSGPDYEYTLQAEDEVDYETEEVIVGGDKGLAHPARYLINMGENIVSLRQLLRRSIYVMNVPNGTVSNGVTCTLRHPRYPLYYGFDTSGDYSAVKVVGAGNAKFNYATNNHYTWLSFMYLAQRGSVHWHVNVDGSLYNVYINSVRLSRSVEPLNANILDANSLAFGSTSAMTAGWTAKHDPGHSGLTLTNYYTSTSAAIALPYYSKYKFHLVDPLFQRLGNPQDDTSTMGFQLEYVLNGGVGNSKWVKTDLYFGIGTDFTFFFFMNVPAIQQYPTIVPN